MLFSTSNGAEKRAALRSLLDGDKPIRAPGAFSPLVAMEIERTGFEAVYVSGAGLAADLGLPDIGLTTSNEVLERAEQIARVTDLPTIVDCDTGFGEPMNVARTIRSAEERGIAALHLEDQVNPKRCGHLDGKSVVDTDTMLQRIQAAVDARRDPNLLIIARSDARAIEGLSAMIERANRYVDAGADMVFAEALRDAEEWQRAGREINAPLLANMTEFGKSELLSADQLYELGASIIIYPVTMLRLAMRAVAEGLTQLRVSGHQRELVAKMQTRAQLYELLRYEQYTAFDQQIFSFNDNA